MTDPEGGTLDRHDSNPARPVMSEIEDEDTATYQVVINPEEQYSIWWADRDPPPGWHAEGKSGLKADCLAYIDEIWTDMRPLSLRREMAERAAAEARGEREPELDEEPWMEGPTLVERLSQGEHPVAVSVTPEGSSQALSEAIARGYVHVTFTATRGGTELGLRLDREACELAALEAAQGTMRLVGRLTLDYVPVRCVAQVDVATLTGHGHLEPG
jgi:uncharacterized protein YbdZ (MbtH family)